MSRGKRSYDSTRRREQALATRARLLASARRLFRERGYAVTTIAAIAADAGIAEQTVYATLGSKRGVLLALLDEVEREVELPAALAALRAPDATPPAQLRTLVELNVRLYSHMADVLAIVRAAGDADPDLGALWREGESRRRRGQAGLVRRWARAGALRRDLSASRAADVLWALTGPDLFRLFAVERGWSLTRFADWLAATLEELLLARRSKW